MTQAEVQQIIDDAAGRGITIDELDASTFLGAREMLAADPTNKICQQVVQESIRQFTTGEEPTSFARFTLPVFETTEELASRAAA
jgi:hypothetical protein